MTSQPPRRPTTRRRATANLAFRPGRQGRGLLIGLVLVAGVIWLLPWLLDRSATSQTDIGIVADTAKSTTAPVAASDAVTGARERFSDLPTIGLDQLPPEAIDTLELIVNGGPYPFNRDDSVFQNREGILPDRPPGHYREYTVITPGENDRGARRLVAGAHGEFYYTSDHYASFSELVGKGQ